MLIVNQVNKSFGDTPILESVSFTVNSGERLALIGPNGSGKTTLLSIITGRIKPDGGHVEFTAAGMRLGYLPQGAEFKQGETIGGYLDRCEGNLANKSEKLAQLAAQITKYPDRKDLQAEYDAILTQFELASEESYRGAAITAKMGLVHFSFDTPIEHLSGGQKTRLALAGALVARPQLLLLDEPTNHLDLEMLAWLEDWLRDFPGGILYVSHDRSFLDRTATGILELDPHTKTVHRYAGNYTAYLEEKLAAREKQRQEYSDQQEEIARLQSAIQRKKKEATYKPGGKADSDKFAKGFYSNRSAGTIKRAKNLEKRIDYLMNDGRVEKPQQSWQVKIEFGDVPNSGRDVLVMENLAVGYGDNILLENLNQTIRYGERVALVGGNGTGKTTLLRTITGELSPLSGDLRLGANVHPGYMRQEQEELAPELNALLTIRSQAAISETDARTFLSYFLFTGDEVFLPVSSLSYGERARLSLAGWVIRGSNFLMLDEPINHLDIPSRTRFEQALTNFEGTVLAVVHDRYFIDGFATQVWEVKGRRLVVHDKITRF